MLATFLVEISLVIYAIVRYRLNLAGRLIVLALLLLATFQIAEYFVCGGAGLNADQWSRLGYAAITALPPIGLHLMNAINGKSANTIVKVAYATMAAYIVYYLFVTAALVGHQCQGNYVIFEIGGILAWFYGLYYFGWLLAALFLGFQFLVTPDGEVTKADTKKLTKALMIGYGIFLVPSALVYLISPHTRAGIPSIMCGFAVLFALIIAFYILPRIADKKSSNKQRRTKQ